MIVTGGVKDPEKVVDIGEKGRLPASVAAAVVEVCLWLTAKRRQRNERSGKASKEAN
jgi:hypothetical protein